MNKRFTVEESNLISIFMEEGIDSDVGGRKNVINGINKTLKHLEDDEMVELSLCVLAKLKELTDHEFEDGFDSGRVTSNVRQNMAFGGCVLSFRNKNLTDKYYGCNIYNEKR